MVQGFYSTTNLNTLLKRLMNQYNLITPEGVDYNDDADSNASKASYNAQWPKSLGSGWSTLLEQDEETGDYHFNLLLTQEEVDSMPPVDNPTFRFTAENEGEIVDGEFVSSFVLPTF